MILIVDFYWQLKQVAKVAKQEPTPARSLSDLVVVLLALVLLVLVLFARSRAAEEEEV